MKKILFISLMIFLTTVTGFGQVKIKRSSLSPGGGISKSGSITLVSSVGELKTEEKDNGNTHLSEGFINPDIMVALKVEDYEELSGIKMYPNPVKDNLYVKFSTGEAYELHLFDVSGNEIFIKPDNVSKAVINMTGYPTGIYILGVVDRKNKKVKTFKFRKE